MADQILRVAILQPTVPLYRVSFFQELITLSQKMGVEIHIYAGQTPSSHVLRGDVPETDFVRILPTKEFRIWGRTIFVRSIKPVMQGDYALIVAEHALKNLETFALLIRRGHRRVAFWGHGKSYTKKVSLSHARLKGWLLRQGAWFFAYTQEGADAAVRLGFDSQRVTILNNSIDTAGLRESLESVTDQELRSFELAHGLVNRTALYIGALDSYKRISFLLDAAIRVHELDPRFRLLIGGSGVDRSRVEKFADAHKWVRYLGVLAGSEKSLALRAAQVMTVPGSIGLVALESLTAGIPIVTTNHEFHGPEFEYLESGVTAVVSQDNVTDFAKQVLQLMDDEGRRLALRAACLQSSQKFGTERMAENFIQGLEGALASSK